MGAIGVFNFGDERHEVQLTLVGAFAKIRVRNRNRTWSNQFQAGYIEQLTQRTGSFKSFADFCQCLSSAIQSTSTEATLELLTPTDLDALRVNKGQAGRTQNPDRRYLLLVITDSTFNTRVHYPLSLNEEVQVLSSATILAMNLILGNFTPTTGTSERSHSSAESRDRNSYNSPSITGWNPSVTASRGSLLSRKVWRDGSTQQETKRRARRSKKDNKQRKKCKNEQANEENG